MPVVVAARSNMAGTEGFGRTPWYGLAFTSHLQNDYRVVRSEANVFAVEVLYAESSGFYPVLITFESATGFVYENGVDFPRGVVDWIGVGFPGDGPDLPPDPGQNVAISGLAGLGLSVGQIVANPALAFAGDDVITGGTGMMLAMSDEIYAGDGDDTIIGADTDGRFDLGRGNGSVDGGGGNDFLRMDFSDRAQAVQYTHDDIEALVRVGEQAVVTVRNIESVEIIGGSGYDTLVGGAGNDVIDLFTGGGFADGGEGWDRARLDFSNETRSINYTHDRVAALATANGTVVADVRNSEMATVIGGLAADTLTGWDDDDRLSGGAGNDVLTGGGGSDILIGGAGNDRLDGGVGYDYVQLTLGGTVDLRLTGPQDLGEGLDTLTGIEGVLGSDFADHLTGTDETNTLRGAGGDDIIHGGGGNDVLTGGTGHNLIYGGDGDDQLNGWHIGRSVTTSRNTAEGSNEMHGGAGNDQIFGANGDDVLYGDDGDDTVWGWGGQAELYGGTGDDTLVAGEESDYLEGGDGNDILSAGWGNDVLIGGEGNDSLVGDGGGGVPLLGDTSTSQDDVLDGGAGNDVMQGGFGDDVLRDSGGDDHMDGSVGFDIVDYSGASAGVVVSTYIGWDIHSGNWASQDTVGAGIDRLIDIDGLIGTAFDDHLSGRMDEWAASEGFVFDEYFDGGHGDDLISGGSGADTILGGAGSDILDGDEGDDTIDGGEGWDTLLLSGSRDDYRVLRSGDDFIIKGLDGLDRVSGVEILRFSDGTIIDLARQVELSPGDEAGDGAFVLPAVPDDRPLVLPDAETDKFADDALVLPGADDPAVRLFAGLEARLELNGDRMITLGADGRLIDEPAHRDGGWLF